MESLILNVKESYNELVHKVTWPSWQSLLSSTRLVIVASVIIALIIFVMDLIFNGLILQNVYEIKF